MEGDILPGEVEFVSLLQIHPEIGAGAEKAGEAKGGICRDCQQ